MKQLLRGSMLATLLIVALPAVAANEVPLYNFYAQETQLVDPSSLTPESALAFVPQIPEAVSIYELYLSQGDDPLSALMKSYREVLIVLQASQAPQGAATASQ